MTSNLYLEQTNRYVYVHPIYYFHSAQTCTACTWGGLLLAWRWAPSALPSRPTSPTSRRSSSGQRLPTSTTFISLEECCLVTSLVSWAMELARTQTKNTHNTRQHDRIKYTHNTHVGRTDHLVWEAQSEFNGHHLLDLELWTCLTGIMMMRRRIAVFCYSSTYVRWVFERDVRNCWLIWIEIRSENFLRMNSCFLLFLISTVYFICLYLVSCILFLFLLYN